MEFLRPDTHHLDSCFITWNHPDTRMKVTTYPMLHVGNELFYQRVSEDLIRCQFVLYEGVTWRLGKRHRSTWDLLARNLGLVDQRTALNYPVDAVRINLDMSRGEFREGFFRLPLKSIAFMLTQRYLLWLLTLLRPLRRGYVRYVLLRRRRGMLDDTPLRDLIIRARDRRIVENLRSFYATHGALDEPGYCGIVFGAGHMPAICSALRSFGFRPGTRRWVEVFRIPSEKRP